MRCLLVDDNEAFVETARRVLEPDGVRVAGTASTIGEALLRASELQPDVVLVDIMLGDENGFDLARRLAGSHRGFRVYQTQCATDCAGGRGNNRGSVGFWWPFRNDRHHDD